MEIGYPDYAAWQRQWLTGERLKEQGEYWRGRLSGAPMVLEVPTDRARPKEQRFEGKSLGVRIEEGLTERFKRVSQREGTTLFMTLLGAWAVVLSRLSGQEEVIVGTPTANRSRKEVEGLIGFFVNTLALRIGLGGSPSLKEVLGRVKEAVVGAQDNQDLPFEQVVEIAQPPRRLDTSPVFQVCLGGRGRREGEREGLELSGVEVEPLGGTLEAVKFEMELELGEAEGAIRGALHYATALFDEETIERHRGYFLSVLRALVEDAQQKARGVELLGKAERARLLHEWNETGGDYPKEKCIHQLFEEQVERTPHAVAVLSGGGADVRGAQCEGQPVGAPANSGGGRAR